MSKFRNLIESILLNEAVLKCDIPPSLGDMFNDLTFDNKIRVLKNPSDTELEMFLNNSKAKQLRSVTINGDIYYVDAFIAIHNNLTEILEYNGYIDKNTTDYIPGYTSQDNFDYTDEKNATKDLGGLYQIYRDITSKAEIEDMMEWMPNIIKYISKAYPMKELISPNKDGINQFMTKLQQIQ